MEDQVNSLVENRNKVSTGDLRVTILLVEKSIDTSVLAVPKILKVKAPGLRICLLAFHGVVLMPARKWITIERNHQ